jgi:putative ABC transport system permease protein
MINKLFRFSLRSLTRQKTFMLINVLGLAVGFACSLIIAVFIRYELSYDQYHENKDRIYRVVLNGKIGGQEIVASWSAFPVGPAVRDEFPEVEAFLRLNTWGETVVRHEDQAFIEPRFMEADSSFFDFFSIPLLVGNKATALTEPFSVVLSRTAAEKIFGDSDPLGQMILVGTGSSPHQVTGIMEDIPENSHFHANMIGSFNTYTRNGSWMSNNLQTYVMLYPEATTEAIDERFRELIVKYVGPEIREFIGISIEDFLAQGNRYNYYLQPLTRIHLDPGVENDFKAANDPKYLWIFGSIGLLILVIASINFMNLSTAQATKRAREVGVKKVVGSTRNGLIRQFLAETVALAFLAFVLAVMLAEIALPHLNTMIDMNLSLNYFSVWYTVPVLILITLFIGVLAGSYPAFYLSSFNPSAVLKGVVNTGKGNTGLRRVLTVIQFTISIVLIISTLIMFRQINYMIKKDVGFDKEHVLVIRRAGALRQQHQSFKEEVRQIAGVMYVSLSTAVPGYSNNANGYTLQGKPEDAFIMQTNWVDYDFPATYGLQISEGRFFDPELLTDREACIINERAVREAGGEDPLQMRLVGNNQISGDAVTLPVIGVMKDFHFTSLRNDIGPYLLQFKHEQISWGYVSIRLSPSAPPSVISDIEKVWASFSGNDPMLYFFMDHDFERWYQEERRSARLSVVFTVLAIMIAALGLYGLTSFTVGNRIKEIGVRKTFGASVFNIWLLICRETILLVGIATAVAWPLVYWVAGNWLQNYHYRISLRITDFLAGFGVALLISLLTISYRAIRAASINPSLSLRYE